MILLKPVVALVGRPNVGKSALFNRLVGGSIAVVDDTPGVTRDRIYGDVNWTGKEFVLIDTGGVVDAYGDDILAQVGKQVELAIREADVIVFTLDTKIGLTEEDKRVGDMLRNAKKPVVVAANKSENYGSKDVNFYEFYNLGFGDPIPVSAIHGTNVGDLLDEIVANIPEKLEVDSDIEQAIKVSVLGRPNVGKSSLVNKILKDNRTIVSEKPGTTRDAVDAFLDSSEDKFLFIDTAGLRKKSRIKEGLEKYSVIRSIKGLERSDVALLVIDAKEGVSEQDKKIAQLIMDRGKGVVVVVNKWDLLDRDKKTGDKFIRYLKYEFAFLDFAPFIFVSAVTGKNLNKLLDFIKISAENHCKRIPTGELNRVLEKSFAMYPPPAIKGRRLNIYYATQTKVKPPTFLMFINDKDLVKNSYRKYLKNQLRESFDFKGTPIHIKEKERERKK